MPRKQNKNKKIDHVLQSSDKLLDFITSEILNATEKIYACFPPGERLGKLFEFKQETFFTVFKKNFLPIKETLMKDINNIPKEKTNKLLIVGNLFFELNDLDSAIKIYERIVKLDETNIYAWSNLLTIYLEKNKNKKALECYIHIPPNFMQSTIYEKMNRKLDAYRILNISSLISYEEKIFSISNAETMPEEQRVEYENKLRELYSDIEFAKGQEALANGEIDEALIYFTGLTRKYPKSDILFYILGKTALDGKHYVISEEYLKKAIKIANNVPDYWVALSRCFFEQHKNEQAVKALKTALTLNPSNSEAWELAGKMVKILEALNEYNYLINKLKTISTNTAYSLFANELIASKKYSSALEILQYGTEKFPDDVSLLEKLALVYERMMKFDEAITIYEKLIRVGSNSQKYLRKITSILTILHDDTRLVKILKMVSAYIPINEPALWDKIGNILLKAKDYFGASEAFRKVISFNQNDPKVLFNLALTYQELSLYKKAEETYKKVIELNPHDHAALNNLGNVLKEQKKYDEAIECYKKAVQIEPDKAISFANLGILYEELRLKNEAKECYRKAKEIALKNKDYDSAAKFEEWENSV